MDRRRALALLAVSSLGARAQTGPVDLVPLRAIAFAGGWNLPLWVARREGYFEHEGLALDLAYTPSSGVLVRGLMSGRFDIGMASIDNAIAYQEGQGDDAPAPDADLFAFMAVDRGFLALVAAPDVASVAALRGRTLAVDSPKAGFGFVLRELLKRHGVSEADVKVVRAGATEVRFRDLLAGRFDATLLRTPYDIVAAQRGFRTLATVESLGPYVGTCGLARRSWAQAHATVLIAFLRGYRASMEWLADPAHRRVAEALLVANLRDMTPELAPAGLERLLDPREGLLRRFDIEPAALGTVLELRRAYAEPTRALDDPARYVDLSYLARAMAER
jgi:ABC-type nitrate/sulfonate/bicarbonate transport system substrate-binding protein